MLWQGTIRHHLVCSKQQEGELLQRGSPGQHLAGSLHKLPQQGVPYHLLCRLQLQAMSLRVQGV
jgi:hypothetical protein